MPSQVFEQKHSKPSFDPEILALPFIAVTDTAIDLAGYQFIGDYLCFILVIYSTTVNFIERWYQYSVPESSFAVADRPIAIVALIAIADLATLRLASLN